MNFFIRFLVFISFIYSNDNQTIDGVAAIIEEHIVLKSDLAQMLNMSIIQNKIDPLKDLEKVKALEQSILESMIDQKIILKKAEIDSVSVEENEVRLSFRSTNTNVSKSSWRGKKSRGSFRSNFKKF